jgi:hypothetical protein
LAEIKFHNVDDFEIVHLLSEYLCAIISKMEKLNLYLFEGISADYRCKDTWICRLIFM